MENNVCERCNKKIEKESWAYMPSILIFDKSDCLIKDKREIHICGDCFQEIANAWINGKEVK